MLLLDDIHFTYDRPILKGITFEAKRGEIVALIGGSGSGKTTLFRLITGLLEPDSGTVTCQTLPTYMQQEDLLLPWRTALGNLMLCGELGKELEEACTDEAKKLLRLVGLEGYEEAYPSELSGGMRQRVALARALLQNRPLMLLDEPFGSLDVLIREQLYMLLKQIRDRYQKTILLVTHDFRDAISMADRILVLVNGRLHEPLEVAGQDPMALMQEIRQRLQATDGLFACS